MRPPGRHLARLVPSHMTVPPPAPVDRDVEEMRSMSRVIDDPRFTDSERATARKLAQVALRRVLKKRAT